MKNFTIILTLALILSTSSLSAAEVNPSLMNSDTWTVTVNIDTWTITVSEPILYHNTDYGFNFSLPANWQGYTIITDTWTGSVLENTIPQSGPKLLIRHPKWTAAAPYEDLPILVFTLAQWESYQKEDFSIGAAPILSTELARNNTYVFALPARWDFDYSQDYKEAQDIFAANSLRAYNLGVLPTESNFVLACDQAVTYMKFADTQSLETYLADCKNGKYPEVLEKYKADMNLDTLPPTSKTESVIVTMFQLFGSLFIVYPIFALLPVFILGLFYFQSKNRFIFVTIILWLLYMVYEELHLLRMLCTWECNIRVDLLLIYPTLILLTLVALFLGIKNLFKSRPS